jgi:hypothetical protein
MLPEGNQQLQVVDRIESLRLILERQQSRVVTRDEASEIGESLIVFYEILGESLLPSNDHLDTADVD